MVTHPYLFKITAKNARKERGNKQNNPAYLCRIEERTQMGPTECCHGPAGSAG